MALSIDKLNTSLSHLKTFYRDISIKRLEKLGADGSEGGECVLLSLR